MQNEAFRIQDEKTAVEGALSPRFLEDFRKNRPRMQHSGRVHQNELVLRVGEGRFPFHLHSCSPAAFINGIPDELAISLQTNPNTELRAQSQHSNRLPADVGVGIKDPFFELLERQRGSHPKSLNDEPLHNCPDLLNRRQVW